jgi:hypothetical protein
MNVEVKWMKIIHDPLEFEQYIIGVDTAIPGADRSVIYWHLRNTLPQGYSEEDFWSAVVQYRWLNVAQWLRSNPWEKVLIPGDIERLDWLVEHGVQPSQIILPGEFRRASAIISAFLDEAQLIADVDVARILTVQEVTDHER